MLILDCTLRDGGYYNDWDYSFDLVKRYSDAMAAAKIDIVELGFRTLQSTQYLGATAYTTDAFIERLAIPQSLQLAVMLNAKELLNAADQRTAIRSTFSRRANSQVSMVRIAANRNEVATLGPAIEELRELGYDVALNLMQISEIAFERSTSIWMRSSTKSRWSCCTIPLQSGIRCIMALFTFTDTCMVATVAWKIIVLWMWAWMPLVQLQSPWNMLLDKH